MKLAALLQASWNRGHAAVPLPAVSTVRETLLRDLHARLEASAAPSHRTLADQLRTRHARAMSEAGPTLEALGISRDVRLPLLFSTMYLAPLDPFFSVEDES